MVEKNNSKEALENKIEKVSQRLEQENKKEKIVTLEDRPRGPNI